jgi:bifunctional non-homologous end joining protein LigD
MREPSRSTKNVFRTWSQLQSRFGCCDRCERSTPLPGLGRGPTFGSVPLAEYRKKRRFGVTSEPRGKPGRSRTDELVFVIQKHRATALHYDYRLEWKGLMLSWAVPKAPSRNPSIKRTALQVEDHPVEYNQFEGVIPAGEYGAGTVMIWDGGTGTPACDDVNSALREGHLKFSLTGDKLRGSWVLIRTRGGPAKARAPWLLIKRRDQWAGAKDVAESAPRSAASNRLLVETARDEGGDMKKAVDGEPPALLRKILKNPKLLTAAKRKAPETRRE